VTASQVKVRDFLQRLPLFRELSAKELDFVASHTKQVHAAAGTVLFRRGEPCLGFYLVVYGQVKVAFNESDGAEKVIEIVDPDQGFGESLMFLEEPHIGFAETLSDSLLLLVGKKAVLSAIDRNPRFARCMLARLAQRLRSMITDIEAYTLKSSAQRIVSYLLRDIPADTHSSREIRLSTAKSVVASRLSITREHFSRVLHQLAQAGLIDIKGRTIRVMDPGRLRLWPE
jgi:CRP-like cAMP-binding protein